MTHEEYEAKKADLLLQYESLVGRYREHDKDAHRLRADRNALDIKIRQQEELIIEAKKQASKVYEELYNLMTDDVFKKDE